MDEYTVFRLLSTVPRAAAQRLGPCLIVALFCAALSACGASAPPPPPPHSLTADQPGLVLWPRAEKAVRLRLHADRNLNMYDSKAHSLQVCIYQLDKPDAFLELAKTQEGVTELLKAVAFDKSVKNVVRLFVQPLENASYELDRAEDATFVGVVCGYFDAAPEDAAGVWEIKPQTATTGHLFWKSTTYSAGTLDLSLHLAARAMTEGGGHTRESQ